MKSNLNFYIEKEKKILADLARYERQSGILSILRLITFAGSAGFVIWGIASKNTALNIIGALFFVAFVVLCIIHGKISDNVRYLTELSKVVSSYIARIKGDFDALEKIRISDLKRSDEIENARNRLYGKEFEEPSHDYCVDLDIFGKKSLFSLLNVSETAFGRRKFADALLNSEESDTGLELLKAKQQAVEEFCSIPEVLMDYQATAGMGKMTKYPKALLDFSRNGAKTSSFANALGIIGCAVWLMVLIAFIAAPQYALSAIPVCMFVNLLIWIIGNKFNGRYIEACEGMPSQVSAILRLYLILEKAGFDTGTPIEVLKKLDDAIKISRLRSQPILAFLINAILPLDYLISFLLGNWADKYGKLLPGYIDRLAEYEALMCIAQTGLVFTESTFPEFVNSDAISDNAVFEGKNLVHPLLDHDSVVSNSITIRNDIAIITGSNMSGKTTMIRTVGVCTVLAMAGGLVPASKLTLGRMRVVSSMRIVDSLEENMSTFKAELIRISGIVNASKEERTMMFLIDEIFRGTNSDDRTEGALTVLRRLSKPYVCGLMTTHDYAMIDKTETGFTNIRYYHFSESYTDSGVDFDYKLASGISRQSNAKFLMKLVGIE